MKKISNTKKVNKKKKKINNNKNKGFTLVELLAVIAILSIIITIVIYTANGVINSARNKTYQVTINNIQSEAANYVIEDLASSEWVDDESKRFQYQCVTVQNLIDTGYFKSDVLESMVGKDTKVKANDNIYLERDINTKTVTKNFLLVGNRTENGLGSLCDGISTNYSIEFSVVPVGWSKEKDITIKYKLKNYSNVSNYKYNYVYLLGNGTEYKKLDDKVFGSDYATENLIVDKNGSLKAKIGDFYKDLVVSKIDNISPTANIKYDAILGGSNKVKLEMNDEHSGVSEYYFGKLHPNDKKNYIDWEKKTATSSITLNADVNESGTWYLGVKDLVGNMTVVSKEIYRVNYYLGKTTIGSSICFYSESNACKLNAWNSFNQNFPNSNNGWSFAGWNTSTSGKTVSYSNGQEFTYNKSSDLNLYAIGSRTFRFYSGANGAEISNSSQTQYWNPYSSSYVSSINVPKATSIDKGWEFHGYRATNDASSEVKITTIGTYTPTYDQFTAFDFRTIYKRNLTISYDGNGGTGTTTSTTGVQYFNSGKLSSGANVSEVSLKLESNSFRKTGYTFSKWNTKKDGSGTEYSEKATYKWEPEVSVEPTKTMYAKWTANTYTISYTFNGGTKGKNAPTTGTFDSILTIDNPAKTVTVTGDANGTGATIGSATNGVQTFEGWTYSDGTSATAKYGKNSTSVKTSWSTSTTKVTDKYFKNLRDSSGTVILTANWTPKGFKLPTVSKVGNTCKWNTKKDGSGTEYNSGATYTPTANSSSSIKMYAICTPRTYNIKYYLGNGTSTADSIEIGRSECTYGESCTLNTWLSLEKVFPYSSASSKNRHWSFIGWGTSDSDTSVDHSDGAKFTYNKANDINLYAIGGRRFYFYMGTISDAVLIEPSPSGSHYQYWNPHSTATSQLTSITIPDDASSLDDYSWEFLGYKCGSNTANSTVDFDTTTVGKMQTPSYDHYNYCRSKYSRTLTISYDGNGGTDSTDNTTKSQYYVSGINNDDNPSAKSTPKFTLATNGFSKKGNTFKEWNTKKDGTGSVYEEGDTYNAWSPVVDGKTLEKTMYAQWTPNTYVVKYNCGTGTGTKPVDQTVTYGTNFTVALNTCSKKGYTFNRWTTNSNETDDSNNWTAGWNGKWEFVNGEYGIADGELQLYPVWTPNTYTITYYNGSTKLTTSNHTYGTAKKLTKWDDTVNNSDFGWEFYGWSTANNNTTRTYTDEQSVTDLTDTKNGNINLYAVYKRTVTFKSGKNKFTSSTVTQYWNPYGTTNGTHVSAVTSPALTAIPDWTALGFRNDTTANSKEYDAGKKIYPAVNGGATLYGVYSRSHSATFYSGVNKKNTKTVSGTKYYNTNTSTLPTSVSIKADTAANCTDISNWTELGWRDDTTADAKQTSFGSSLTLNFGTNYNYYAVYSRTLTISYNGNGKTGGSTAATTKTIYLNSNSTTTSDQTVKLAANSFVKTDHTFDGWSTKTDGSGTKYAAGTDYKSNLAYNESTFGKTFYATWKINGHYLTVSACINGEKCDTENKSLYGKFEVYVNNKKETGDGGVSYFRQVIAPGGTYEIKNITSSGSYVLHQIKVDSQDPTAAYKDIKISGVMADKDVSVKLDYRKLDYDKFHLNGQWFIWTLPGIRWGTHKIWDYRQGGVPKDYNEPGYNYSVGYRTYNAYQNDWAMGVAGQENEKRPVYIRTVDDDDDNDFISIYNEDMKNHSYIDDYGLAKVLTTIRVWVAGANITGYGSTGCLYQWPDTYMTLAKDDICKNEDGTKYSTITTIDGNVVPNPNNTIEVSDENGKVLLWGVWIPWSCRNKDGIYNCPANEVSIAEFDGITPDMVR